MLNAAMLGMAADERIADMRRSARPRAPHVAARRRRTAHPQQAFGWFLVSVGLRLALPRTRVTPSR
jgi:hypothetical protein